MYNVYGAKPCTVTEAFEQSPATTVTLLQQRRPAFRNPNNALLQNLETSPIGRRQATNMICRSCRVSAAVPEAYQAVRQFVIEA